jgi:DNA-binding ferritin-like protein
MNPNLLNALLGVWAALRAEHQLFWTYHWRAKGSAAYGDHLLFQRLYEARVAEIDRMGEVVMAVGGSAAVDPLRSWVAVREIIDGSEQRGSNDAARGVALVADTLNRIDAANKLIGEGTYSLAINNVLAGISDKHLEALYLLRQRVGQS